MVIDPTITDPSWIANPPESRECEHYGYEIDWCCRDGCTCDFNGSAAECLAANRPETERWERDE